MRYHALACDYDGTLAHDGRVEGATLRSLRRLRDSGRKLILVTGRQLPDLARVCPFLDQFDRVVAENGALLYRPDSREERLVAEAPPNAFAELLQQRGVPVSVGRVVVSTHRPHESVVLEAIRHLGLELHVIFNRTAVMVLPSGVNKAAGLGVALDELGLSPHNVVGIGDAENDHALLDLCECAVAVPNALPAVRKRADFVTTSEDGQGVVELAARLVADDLSGLPGLLARRDILLGTSDDGLEVRIPCYGENVLIAGTSGSGKSTLATGFLERLADREYQFCIVDPEGDYQTLEHAVSLGDTGRPPNLREVMQLLEKPRQNAAVNLLGIALEQRPTFFEELLKALVELRARVGRPHWILIDETHHLLPTAWAPSPAVLPETIQGLVLITVHPNHVSRAVLATIGRVVVVGKTPDQTLRDFGEALGIPVPILPPDDLPSGEALAWRRGTEAPPIRFRRLPSRTERRRHLRKYMDGDLGPEQSFYFRGPEEKLNLRAQNLSLFLQLADGVDDATWTHHLRRHDYSRWFRDTIKDTGLADAVEGVEAEPTLSPSESRTRIRASVEERYTDAA